jgi:hypothetical protein
MTSPLFTQALYTNLGIHWGSSVPAFLSLACAPIPFVLSWKLGKWLRDRSKFATEARKVMEHILQQQFQAGGKDSEKADVRVMAGSLSFDDEEVSR